MKSILRIALLALLAGCLLACSDDDADDAMPATVVDAARSDGRFDTLIAALEATGLDETLEGEGPFTVLAPTDEAFGLLPAGLIDLGAGAPPAPAGAGVKAALTGMQVAEVLQFHVLDGAFRAADIVGEDSVTPLAGGAIPVQVLADDSVVLGGRVRVTATDIETRNGVVHVIDAVLLPGDLQRTLNVVEILASSPRFSTLVGAVAGEGLAPTLSGTNGGSGFTVFAPTNAAFDRLPGMLVADLAMGGSLDDVLLYHVLGLEADSSAAVAAAGSSVPTLAPDGGGFFAVTIDTDGDGDLFLDGRTQVVFTDIVGSNGIIHVLDSVLVPGVDFPGTLVEALAAYPRFDSLVDAVVDEGLAGAVTDVTVFAPTNDAFASADLMGQPLSAVLAYHLLDDVLDSGSLGATEPTLQGGTISIAVNGGVVINGSSNVVFADVAATDGIIHVIDEVLVPPAPTN